MSQEALGTTPGTRPATDAETPATAGSFGAAHSTISARPAPIGTRLRELWGSRGLFVLLFARELKVRYRQTFLGVAWVVLQPLVPALLVAAVLGAFARLPSAGVPYVLFALAGFVVFGVFAGAVSRAATSFIRDGQLVTRVYFPRSILPLASGTVAIADFAVGLVLLIAIEVVLGWPLPATIVLAPLVGLLALVLGLAIGTAVAAVTGHYRDAAIAVPFATQLLLYGSPVLYSTELLPASIRPVVALNPLVPLVNAFRAAALGTVWPTPQEMATGVVTGSILVLLSLAVFERAARDLADVV